MPPRPRGSQVSQVSISKATSAMTCGLLAPPGLTLEFQSLCSPVRTNPGEDKNGARTCFDSTVCYIPTVFLPKPKGSTGRWTGLLVYGTSFVLLCVAIWYVAAYGTDVPSWDDWDMVPTMTQQQPVTPAWLWSQHNEHRVPLARLVMLGMYRIRPDFRICMYLNVAMMATLAFSLIRCAKRLRGKLAATDVFFPLVLLGLAQGLNFIWGWQVEFFASTALALCILLL